MRPLAKLASSDPRKHSVALLVATGALWPEARRVESGLSSDPLCQRCHRAVDSPLHMFWECEPCIDAEDEAIQSSNYLIKRAPKGMEVAPCLWARGIPHGEWFPPPPPQDVRVWEVGAAPAGKVQVHRWFTDGSGGKHSSDKMLRRCGWAAVLVFGPPGEEKMQWAIFGGLPAGQQTTPQAELMAATIALEKSAAHGAPGVEVLSDCRYVVDGFAARRRNHRQHRDLWDRLWKAVDEITGTVRVLKVKAHATDDEVRAGMVTPSELLGNHIADGLAGLAAEKHQLGEGYSDNHSWASAVLRQIQNRLIAIASFCVGHTSMQARVKMPSKGLKRKRQDLAEAIASSTHYLVRRGRWMRCLHCGQVGGGRGLRALAAEVCPRRPAPARTLSQDAEHAGTSGHRGALPVQIPGELEIFDEEEEDPFGHASLGLDGEARGSPAEVHSPRAPVLVEPHPKRPTPASEKVRAWGLDTSHDLVEHFDAVVCRRCGAYAISAPRTLRQPCPRVASARGRAAISRVSKGLPLA